MKLKDDFFKIEEESIADNNKIEYTIRLNPEHFIYKAHFPGNPITPGVCITQIIKELLEEQLQCELFLRKTVKVRYLNVINPTVNEIVNLTLSITEEDEKNINISAIVYYNDITFSQLSFVGEKGREN